MLTAAGLVTIQSNGMRASMNDAHILPPKHPTLRTMTMQNESCAFQNMRLAPLGIHYGLVHAALLKGKTDLAHRLARPLLQLGDASTQWYLGLMHHTGTGVDKDLAAARRCYATSAAQGFSMGEDGLLMLTASERKAYVDPALLKAPSSQTIYSDLKQLKCFAQDTEVVLWEFQRGADLGNIQMQILLGNCYEKGICVPAQWEIALEWYRRAGAQGSQTGLESYKILSSAKLRDRGHQERCELEFVCEMAVASTLRGPEPANEVDAFWWYFDAAQKDDMYACWRLSDCYLVGYGVEPDVDQSNEYSCFVIESGFDEYSEGFQKYSEVLSDTPCDELIDHEALLNKRRQLRAEMARPISLGSPTSLHASTLHLGLATNDNRDTASGQITGAC